MLMSRDGHWSRSQQGYIQFTKPFNVTLYLCFSYNWWRSMYGLKCLVSCNLNLSLLWSAPIPISSHQHWYTAMNLYSITSMIFIHSLHVTLLLWCMAGNLQHWRSGELIDSLQLITTTLLTAVSLPWNAGLYAPFPHCHTSGSTLHSRTSGPQCGPPPPNAARRGGCSHTQTVGILLEHETPVHMHVRTYSEAAFNPLNLFLCLGLNTQGLYTHTPANIIEQLRQQANWMHTLTKAWDSNMYTRTYLVWGIVAATLGDYVDSTHEIQHKHVWDIRTYTPPQHTLYLPYHTWVCYQLINPVTMVTGCMCICTYVGTCLW